MSSPPATPPMPPLLLAVLAIGIAGAAALANCALLAALLKRSQNGLSSILIQLSLADFILIVGVYGPELWASIYGSWCFGYTGCKVVRGLDVFASTASVYLVATVAMHSLATISYEEKSALRRRKRIHQEEEEIRSSRHSLVASSDSSTPPRTMHIDYRFPHERVKVAPPSVFVWILAASLSVPEFTLTNTVPSEDGYVSCTLVESSQSINFMLAVFDMLFPALIYSVIVLLILVKLKSVKRVLDGQYELIASLRLSVCLIVAFVALSAPRSAAALYRAVAAAAAGEPAGSSLLQPGSVAAVLTMSFSGLAFLATLVRPILCITLLPSLLRVFSYGDRTHTGELV